MNSNCSLGDVYEPSEPLRDKTNKMAFALHADWHESECSVTVDELRCLSARIEQYQGYNVGWFKWSFLPIFKSFLWLCFCYM